MPKRPEPPPMDGDYTFDPDLLESDRTVGRAPIYQEEAGAKRGTPAAAQMVLCESCGTVILWGETLEGARLAVEPATRTYVVLWQPRAAQPTLLGSRGYPVHVCPKETTHA